MVTNRVLYDNNNSTIMPSSNFLPSRFSMEQEAPLNLCVRDLASNLANDENSTQKSDVFSATEPTANEDNNNVILNSKYTGKKRISRNKLPKRFTDNAESKPVKTKTFVKKLNPLLPMPLIKNARRGSIMLLDLLCALLKDSVYGHVIRYFDYPPTL